MALDEEQQQTARDWYSLHVKQCPLCACAEYMIEAVVGMPEVLPTGLNPNGGFVVVPIVCLSCGYTILVSATSLKFFKPMRPPT
jgi:predicted nucleic-acid-binding Zn-ribbon protein